MSTELKQQCHTHLPGNREDSPAEHFAKMAKWCEDNNVKHDVYGEGETIQAFEQKVADLLGYEAGLFVVTGTMTQPTVLELVTKQKPTQLLLCTLQVISMFMKDKATSCKIVLISYQSAIHINRGS